MTPSNDIWGTYEDFELAFALHYRGGKLAGFDKGSLYAEIARRGLTSVGLRILIDGKLKQTNEGHEMTQCPRCTSSKVVTVHAESTLQDNTELVLQPDSPTYVEQYICQVCDYNISTHQSQKKRQRNQKLSIALVLVMMLVMLLIVLL